MSQDWYFKNMTKNEYIRGTGNGNFMDSLRYSNPLFIVWVMMEKWKGDEIRCFPEHEMPNGGYSDILDATNKTSEYRKAYAENEILNKYVKDSSGTNEFRAWIIENEAKKRNE